MTACLKACSQLVLELSKQNQQFEDPEYGPSDEDPYGQKSIYYDNVMPGYPIPEDLKWLKMNEISKKEKPVFFDKDGAQANDVIQGSMGDCWFIGALSILASDDELFFHQLTPQELKENPLSDQTVHKLTQGVYPKIFHFLDKYGIYVFRFFKNCSWLYVMIDDKIPCYAGNLQNPQIVFAQCHVKNEFWVPLIEKAYAKLHGSYEALNGGQLDDGLVDMTGRVSEKLKLHNKANKFNTKEYTKEKLWKYLLENLDNKSMMGSAINKTEKTRGEGKVYHNGEFIGLMSGHAYGLMDLVKIKDKKGQELKLVRCRNPWGSQNPVEWNGAWSDNSPALINHLKELNEQNDRRWGQEAEKYLPEDKDGAFLMSYEDFILHYSRLVICKKFHEDISGVRFFCEWSEENSFGIPVGSPADQALYVKNTQFMIRIQKETNLYVSLGQEDGRLLSKGSESFPYKTQNFALNLCVFKRPNKNNIKLEYFDAQNLINQPILIHNRDFQLNLTLEKGIYIIVPTTARKGDFSQFFLSFYYNCRSSEIEIEDLSGQFTHEPIQEEEENVKVFDEHFKQCIKEICAKEE